MKSQAFQVRMAASEADLHAVQRLRYDVFVNELGGSGAEVDHLARHEADKFDPFADHLLLEDLSRPKGAQVVGTYRLMTATQAQAAGGFYSASEYDLAPLIASGRRLLELGRSCLHPDYRGGPGLWHLWNGLARHVFQNQTEVLFGVASFHGTDVAALAQPLSYLAHFHSAAGPLLIKAQTGAAYPMAALPITAIDRKVAMAQMPGLIKAYLRLGAVVGEGAFVDHAFNTVDVSLLVDVTKLTERQIALFTKALPA